MFRLDKLEIAGFKSFCDPAQLVFPAALTAVVGPNGCGKSNICDALIWVLGENRASHIRGGTMEDVIFQGSERRRALGMGEVTLTLGTDNGHPAAEDGRIVINRRVFRTGESEFRLNGRRVRLRDIADILMDTGLGIRNYSVMEQGKIDLILSNKPQDRRKLIEEAAGITKYKTKRRAAELKLEETQANLLRIDDTLAEVTRNLNSLKRQASKARRHRELVDQLSTAKRTLYAGKIVLARSEQGAAEAAVREAQNLESESTALLGREEADLAETRRTLTDRSGAASSLREEIARTGSEVDRLRSFLEQSETTLADLIERAESAGVQTRSLHEEAVEQQQLFDEKSRALRTAVDRRNELREVSDALEQERRQKGDRVRTDETRLASLREGLMRTIARISEARNQVHQIEIAVEKCEFYLGKLSESARKASEGRDAARARLDQARRHLQDAEQGLLDAQRQAREAASLRDDLTGRRDAMRGSLATARDAISQTTYRIDSLRSLLTSLESQDEQVRATILELIPRAASAAEAVRAAEGAEAALDALLRDITSSVVVENASVATVAIARLNDRGAGRGSFLRLDWRVEGVAADVGSPAAGAVIGEGAVADAVRAAVPHAVIVESLGEALDRSAREPSTTFVTRGGEIVRGPLVIGGRQESARGVFSIKRELADLEKTLAAEELRASGIAVELEQVEASLRAADDARILAEERVRQAEQLARERAAARDRGAAELDRFEKDLEVASEEQALYLDEKSQLLTRRDQAIEDLRSLEENERSTQESIRTTEESLRGAREEFERITESASGARVDLEAAVGVVNAVAREHDNLSRIVASLEARSGQFTREIETLSSRRSETERAVDQARQQLGIAMSSLGELGERRVVLEAEVADLGTRLGEVEARASAARERWNARREGLFEAERRLDRARGSFDLLREQISLDLHAGIDALNEVAPPEDEQARESLESEVARLTDQLEKMGPVNVLAIEEHQELEERERFLRTQRDDLVQAIESLRTTIRKINLTSRELFREAFTAVNQYFSEVFSVLFGGGRAGMQLLDEEDVLESGIELIAQPPGKKTQSISLLSGGERALTALALLFAIFRYKPSPFCILDEVDAPLDELNNERFVRLLREMSHDTQFIVITHSKRTMEAADVLYGVTMEEAGCSRLVSVSFAELEG
ncbi:MAG TPA: chromosome segregation protein SMC [Thermoanaerobaculia bacterium]|nr:chromosome segregation protein SMC [Thermoanaerobaculia bacterium]